MNKLGIGVVAIAVFVISLLVIGIIALVSTIQNRFDCCSTDARTCSEAFLQEALLPNEYLERLYKLICGAHEAFVASGIPYFADGGTLLSLMRHGKLIPWDDDADIGVLSTDWLNPQKKDILVEELNRRGLHIKRGDGLGMITDRIVFKEPQKTIIENPGKENEPFMDVFLYRYSRSSGELVLADTISRLKFPQSRLSPKEAFPLRPVPLYYGKNSKCTVMVPNQSETLLKRLYGNEWRTKFIVSTHTNSSVLLPCTLSESQVETLREQGKL